LLIHLSTHSTERSFVMKEPDVRRLFDRLRHMFPWDDERNPDRNGTLTVRPDSPVEARSLLREFCRQWQEEPDIHPALLEWVAACFDVIADCDTADASFPAAVLRLTRPGHRPKVNRKRDVEIAKAVAALRNEGASLEQACLDVAEGYGLHESNIKKIYLRSRSRDF
jgi:hypothetical protein